MKYELTLKRNGGIPENELLADLKMVSQKLGRNSFSMDDYEKNGHFGRGSFKHKFGSWNKALNKAGLEILKRGNNTITNDELFNNLATVWESLGRQPSQSDLDADVSLFHAGTYKKKFGTYNNALKLFVKWIGNENISVGGKVNDETFDIDIKRHKTKRAINDRLRWIIIKRDNFKCQHCGWSPAKDTGDRKLEVDHIIPWSKGGETILENLQTLCSKCNGGKSNLE